MQSIIAKIINNVQVTVKNIHIRYEDNLSVPGVSTCPFPAQFETMTRVMHQKHPFAAGVTLAGFTVVSVNNEWKPAFIESTAGAIHKVCSV